MMTQALTSLTELLAPTAGTAATPADGEAGTAFNAILTNLLPVDDALTTPVPASLPLTPQLLVPEQAAPDVTESLNLLLPGLALGESTPAPATAWSADAPEADDDAASAPADGSALLPDWLPALPLAAPLQVTAPLAGAAAGPADGGLAQSLTPAALPRAVTSRWSPATPAAVAAALPATDAMSAPVIGATDKTLPAPTAGDDARLPWALSTAMPAQAAGSSAAALRDWQFPSQGLEGLLRSREGRQIQALEPTSDFTALNLGAPTSGSGTAIREPVQLSITQNALQSPDWGDAFNRHLVMLAQQGTQSASIQLNPEDLGPIHVRVSVHEQAASIEFASRHAATSELIESALPRLAGALESQGLRLDDVKLSQLPARADGFSLASGAQQGQQGGAGSRGQGRGEGGQDGMNPVSEQPTRVRHVSVAGPDGVDAYA